MNGLWLVALGGALGAMARRLLSVLAAAGGASWPIGTFVVNLLGCLLMGLLIGLVPVQSERLMLFAGIGFLGSFTTLSAVSLETLLMLERRAYIEALLYGCGTFVVCLLAVMAGLMLGRALS